jgi:hypothetical protein
MTSDEFQVIVTFNSQGNSVVFNDPFVTMKVTCLVLYVSCMAFSKNWALDYKNYHMKSMPKQGGFLQTNTHFPFKTKSITNTAI